MADLTLPDGNIITNSFYESMLRPQVIRTCLSTARPTIVADGSYIHETDTDRQLRWDATTSSWIVMSEPPQSWTPAVSQGVTVTGTVNRAWYQRANGVWEARIAWTATGAGTAANSVIITLPFTMTNLNDASGSLVFEDATGPTFYNLATYPLSTTSVILIGYNVASAFGAAPAVTIASGDKIYGGIRGTTST